MLEVWSNFWTLIGGALSLNGQVLLVARDAPRAYWGRDADRRGGRGLADRWGSAWCCSPTGCPRGASSPRSSPGRWPTGPACAVELGHLGGRRDLAPLRPPPGDHLPGGLLRPGAPSVRFLRDAALPRMSLRRVLDAYSLIVVVAGLRGCWTSRCCRPSSPPAWAGCCRRSWRGCWSGPWRGCARGCGGRPPGGRTSAPRLMWWGTSWATRERAAGRGGAHERVG